MSKRAPTAVPKDGSDSLPTGNRFSKWVEAYALAARVSDRYERAMANRPDPVAFGNEAADAVLSLPQDRKFPEFARVVAVLAHSVRGSFAYGTTDMADYYRSVKRTFADRFLERAYAALAEDRPDVREKRASYRDWALNRALVDHVDFDFWMAWHDRFRMLAEAEKPR